MNYLVLDTETTNLEKPFCYNVGYLIANAETGETLLKRSFVVEQVWHNLALFSSAYYADKRPLYVSAMKGRTTKLDKWGYICGQLARDIKAYSVEIGYAYNSPFDEKVFDFNCDWFKTLNPLDTVKMFDIRGYVHNKLAFTDNYKNFCIEHGLLTESGNISTTAESVYRYVFKDLDFIEEHTALADSEIENEILKHCVKLGCIFGQEYKVYKSIPNDIPKTLTVVYNGEEINYNYTKRTNRGNKIYLK